MPLIASGLSGKNVFGIGKSPIHREPVERLLVEDLPDNVLRKAARRGRTSPSASRWVGDRDRGSCRRTGTVRPCSRAGGRLSNGGSIHSGPPASKFGQCTLQRIARLRARLREVVVDADDRDARSSQRPHRRHAVLSEAQHDGIWAPASLTWCPSSLALIVTSLAKIPLEPLYPARAAPARKCNAGRRTNRPTARRSLRRARGDGATTPANQATHSPSSVSAVNSASSPRSMKSAGIAVPGRERLEVGQHRLDAGEIDAAEEAARRLARRALVRVERDQPLQRLGTRRAGILAASRPNVRASLVDAAADHHEVLRHRPCRRPCGRCPEIRCRRRGAGRIRSGSH